MNVPGSWVDPCPNRLSSREQNKHPDQVTEDHSLLSNTDDYGPEEELDEEETRTQERWGNDANVPEYLFRSYELIQEPHFLHTTNAPGRMWRKTVQDIMSDYYIQASNRDGYRDTIAFIAERLQAIHLEEAHPERLPFLKSWWGCKAQVSQLTIDPSRSGAPWERSRSVRRRGRVQPDAPQSRRSGAEGPPDLLYTC